MPNSTVKPSCPADPCEAAVRVTALQGRAAGGRKNPYYIRQNGYIVAFTVQLSEAQRRADHVLQRQLRQPGAGAAVGAAPGDTRKTRLNYRLVTQTALYDVDKYLGSSPTFVLDPPLR